MVWSEWVITSTSCRRVFYIHMLYINIGGQAYLVPHLIL